MNNKIQLRNGRLYFPSRQILTNEFEKIKDADEKVIYDHMMNYYTYENFLPLRPIATEENEQIVSEQLVKRKENANNYAQSSSNFRTAGTLTDETVADHIDDLEEIIGEDAYASFLNSSAEVQVGDTIYKYTDVGLFSIRDIEYNDLEDYLAVKKISADLLIPTDAAVQQQIITEIPNGGTTQLNNGITYFRAKQLLNEAVPIKNTDLEVNQTARNTATNSVDTEINTYVATLTSCTDVSTFLSELFGNVRTCTDKYESRRRVKTKAFSYNLKLVYHSGTKVKHQYRGWTGIWRQEDTDVLSMGVLAVQFEYDFTSLFPKDKSNIDQSLRAYSVKGWNKIYNVSVDQYGGFYQISLQSFNGDVYPFKLFNDDVVIESWGNNNIVDAALRQANSRLTSAKLNEYFWKTLRSQVTAQLRSLSNQYNYNLPSNVTLLSKHPEFGKLLVQKTHKEVKYNTSKVDKTYDWGFYLNVTLKASGGYTLNPNPEGGGGASYDVTQSSPNIPKNFKVTMYGVAKRGGKWHGSKLELQ